MSEQIPQYLSNENTLKQAVSYETRKAIIRAQREFGMKNYTGTDEENEKLITTLRNNPKLREHFESRAGISNAARQETVRLQESADRNPPARKTGFFRRLFSGGGSSETRDEVIPLGKGQEAEFGNYTTLCAKTTRENAKTLFGIDIPRADAGPQARAIAQKYPQITLDNSRNETGKAQVAYVKIDVVDTNGKSISHVALATKPFGGKEWFVLDPYKSGNSWMSLSSYPARRNLVAYELQGSKDTLTTGRATGSMKVREYKQGLLSENERATENPSVDYGKAVNSDNIFYALGDRDFSGTMGDDGKRKKFLWIIPYGKKQSTNTSDEYHITTELSEIASLPKTNVNKFIAQCIEVGGGGKYKIDNRQQIINLFFPNGQYNKALHAQFLKGFDLLNRAGHIDDVKAKDALTPFTEAQKREMGSVEFTNSHEKLVRVIRDQLLDDSLLDGGLIKKSDPLYAVIKRDSGLADRLARQVAAFVNIKGSSISGTGMASIDLAKHVKAVVGFANGQPGVGLMLHGKLLEGKTGSISGAIGAWNMIPMAHLSGEKYLNMDSVKRNLHDYTQSVQVLRGSVTVTPAGVVVEANKGLYLKWISVGGGVLGGLPMIIAGIRFAYIKNNRIPDAKILKKHVIDMLEGRGLHESTNVRARGLASSINDRSLNIGGTAYAADSMVNNSGQQVLRIRSRLNKNPLNVFAGPGYENNVRIYRDGTIDIIGGTKSIPSITTRNQVVGQETYRYLIVGETRGANAGRISRPTNDLPPEYGRSTKTVNGVHYFATNTTPNVSSPDEREFLIGASMQFLKPEPKPQVSTPEPKKPSVSSRPGNNPPGERPDLPAAESGPTSTITDLPAEAVGIPTQPVQHLDVGAEIPHTYTPTNTPYDPFAT